MTATAQHIIITGATGGIGSATTKALAKRGHRLTLIARDEGRLRRLAAEAAIAANQVKTISADLTETTKHRQLIEQAIARQGPIDTLINNAAINWFGRFEQMPTIDIDRLLLTDIAVPLHMARAVLPHMQQQRAGSIVNVGSVFGGIGFAGFAVYSSCKFALRGFSEALRREVADSGVHILYVAPRYTKTGFNAGAIERMASGLGMTVDEPELVAARIVRAMDKLQAETTIGWPEKFFARLNALMPRLVDGGLARTSRRILQFVDADTAPPPATATAITTTMNIKGAK